MPHPHHIAIVGAGIAGLSCAAALRRTNRDVTVFDKGRRPGGRVATRRVNGLTFDHGAQYATARGTDFSAVLHTMQDAGQVAPWPEAGGDEPRWVGVGGMSAMAQALSVPAGPVLVERHVAWITRATNGLYVRHLAAGETPPSAVRDEGERAGPFDAVLLALPAPQAVGLLRAFGHDFADPVSRVTIAPCWALMLAFETAIDAPPVLRPADGPLSWVACDSTRPGRSSPLPQTWVAHASAAWTREHLEAPPAAVSDQLLGAFRDATGATPQPLHRAVHRWRYALAEQPLGSACLWDEASGIGVCGDWCIGPRIEAAFDSGRVLAATVCVS